MPQSHVQVGGQLGKALCDVQLVGRIDSAVHQHDRYGLDLTERQRR